MISVASVRQMRESDEAAIAAGTCARELMRRAGKAVFDAVEWKSPVAVLCGTGNNGGDGFVLALLLQKAGVDCAVFLPEEKTTPVAGEYLEEVKKRGIPVSLWRGEDLSSYAFLVDCLFGTGFHGSPEGKAKEMIEAVNAAGKKVISVDLNSGLNGDSGLGATAVLSDLTVAVGSFKPGHFLGRAKDLIRKKTAADIGIPLVGEPLWLLEEADVRRCFPPRGSDSHKGTFGTATLIGGSLPYSGAIRLSAMASAAMRCGAGIARIAAPKSLCPLIAPQILEATLFPLSEKEGAVCFEKSEFASLCASSRVIAVGMGIGLSGETEKIVSYFLSHFKGTLVIDADGLNALAALGPALLKTASCRTVLTPHAKEFSRLTGKSVGEILDHPADSARAFAAEYGCAVLLKGAATVVSDGEKTYLSDRGCPGMATAGSGDVLSGVLAALLCQSPEPPAFTAAAAAYLAGRAGEEAQKEVGAVSMIASDTVRHLPGVIRAILGEKSPDPA